LDVKFLLVLSDFSQSWFVTTDVDGSPHIRNFAEVLGSRVVPCRQTDRHDEDDSGFRLLFIWKCLTHNGDRNYGNDDDDDDNDDDDDDGGGDKDVCCLGVDFPSSHKLI